MSVAMILGGAALAAFSLYAAFVAGSDMARIRGVSGTLMLGAIALTGTALILEYHA